MLRRRCEAGVAGAVGQAVKRLLVLLALAGCDKPVADPSGMDQCLRREIFFQCLAAVPRGPENVKYNDWEEVVSTCGQQAQYQSYRRQAIIKPECRP